MNEIENVQTKKAYDAQTAPYAGGDKPKKEAPAKEAERFRKVEDWFVQERQAQANNRFLMARDQDFVDGEQWTAADKAELEERGQPAMVFNLIGTTIRWITGTEKRTRVDYKVAGRGKEDNDSAENKTALLKYLSDVNRGGYHRSKAFEDAVGAGLGWIETGIKSDKGEEPLFERYESWRNVWFDRMSMEPDLKDSRYLFRAKWVDLDVAQAYFPDKATELELAAEDHDSYHADDEFWDVDLKEAQQSAEVSTGEAGNASGKRRRVRLVECWYKEVERCKVLRGPGPYNGAIMSNEDERLGFFAEQEDSEVCPAIRQIMRVMIFISGRANTVGQMLHDGRSPYWHNRFPFIPVWGYRRKRDNLPYGAVRGLIDPQVDLNKRRSKALFILSTNQVIMDKGAVDDVNVLAEEVARPDGIIEKNQGKELNIRNDKQLAQQHVNMMDQDAQFIQRVGGVTDENLGRQTNATSGKAIQARQDQGTTVTADLFDNLRLAMQIAGEIKLSLVEQYYDEPKVIRLIGEKGKAEFREINGSESSITETQADFIVDEQAFNQSHRQAMAEELFALVAKLPPEVALKLMDVVIDLTDLPMRDELVSRIRQINGMKEPGAEPTPEEQEAEEQAMRAENEKKGRVEEANMRLLEGKADEAQAKGMKAHMETLEKKLSAMEKALSVAGVLQVNPDLGGGADEVIADASK